MTSASPNYADDDDDEDSNADKPAGVMDNPEVNEVARRRRRPSDRPPPRY